VGDGDGPAGTDSASNGGVSSWYRFLSLFAVVALLLFAAIIIWQTRSDRVFPVLASVFVLFTFATLILSGVAFWADRYRIPVLTLSLVFITLTNLLPLRVDHQFEGIRLRAEQVPPPVPPRPTEILRLMEPGGTVRPLVVITSRSHKSGVTAWVRSGRERPHTFVLPLRSVVPALTSMGTERGPTQVPSQYHCSTKTGPNLDHSWYRN
jgi:hypothetical protein